MPRISIVMGYKTRIQQLTLTLRTISLFPHQDTEIIVVDDNSNDGVGDLVSRFKNLNLRVIPFGSAPHINPCVVYNRGFRIATGEIVIIQNPETLYLTNVLEYARQNLTDAKYLTFSCFYTKQDKHSALGQLLCASDHELLNKIRSVVDLNRKQWYNHATYRPRCLHFCSAITRTNLEKLGGFDERFADGYCFDDEEFLTRIRRMGLAVRIVPSEEELVVHQWHPSGSAYLSDKDRLWQKNKKLFIDLFHQEPACS